MCRVSFGSSVNYLQFKFVVSLQLNIKQLLVARPFSRALEIFSVTLFQFGFVTAQVERIY